MPEAPTWISLIPDALQTIQFQPEKELWFAEDLTPLFQVEKRQAQKLIKAAAAGAPEKVGKAIAVPRDVLRYWLEMMGGEALQKERARRKRLALKLQEEHCKRVDFPYGHVQVQLESGKPADELVPGPLPRGSVQRIQKGGFRCLPEGIVLGKGQVLIKFQSAQEAAALMFALAQAISKDGGLEELGKRCDVEAYMAAGVQQCG